MNEKRISVLDSTLRDGAQGEEISFSVSDKLAIVKALDNFGVTYIEAGNPGSNPKDLEFFEKIADVPLKNARLCAFGSTRRKDRTADTDENIAAVMKAGTSAVSIFGKSWDLHVTEILKASYEENLSMISDTVRYFKSHGKEVIFDAEHFFDGYLANPDYAMSVLEAAVSAGADVICLCDTNGGTLPMNVFSIAKEVCGRFDVAVGIHTHNDSDCAVANSLMAVEAGIVHVQGTFIGFGERCGNADLSSIIPAVSLKAGITCDGNLSLLSDTAARIAEISNVTIRNNKPYIGKSAFSHKAGMHIDGVIKNSLSFEHIDPSVVGNKRRFLVSEIAGKQSVLQKIRLFAPELTKDSPELPKIVKTLKEMEHFGYQFEAADASFELLARKVMNTYSPHFKVIMFKTIGEFPAPEGEMQATATIKIEVDGKTEITAAMGRGPVNALDIALRKALTVFYPELNDMQLTDYKVRVLDEKEATAAKVRVLIESTDKNSTWSTIGVSEDIIQASLIALTDSIEYKLSKGGKG